MADEDNNAEQEATARRLEQEYAANSKRKFSIKKLDMDDDEMAIDAIAFANEALDAHEIEQEVAQDIKSKFDKKHGVLWHCVVGKKYGSHVTHEKGSFIYFHIGNNAILLFKSKE